MNLKKLIWFYISILFVNYSVAQENEMPEILNGKIKTILSRAYSPKIENGKIIPGSPEYSVEYNSDRFFDENHNLKLQLNIGRDTNVISRVQYNYDIIKKVKSITIASPDGKVLKRTICNCSEKFFPQLCTEVNLSSGEKDTVLYLYDDDKRLVNKTVKSSNPFISQKTEYFYDDKNNVQDVKVYDVKNKLIEQYKNKFDELNRRTEENVLLVKDNIGKRNVFSYDDKGNIIKMTSYSANNEIRNFWDFVYVYDEMGNWESLIILKNNKARLVVLRKFEYY